MRIRVINAAGWILYLVSVVVKIVIGGGYRSTDFEVHRNWLALTHSLPVSKWYYEATSQWTLDYPPFFAYFEWVLSQFAQFFDPEMLKVANLEYDSFATVVFQRGSVIVADLVLLAGILRFIATLAPISNRNLAEGETQEQMQAERANLLESKAIVLLIATLFNAGLLIVDHIHFQYNGILMGILLLSLSAINGKRPLEGAFWFAVLLQFKHIFLYIAPIYGVFLLRSYCLDETRWWDLRRLRWRNLVLLGFVVVFVTGLSLGPFIAMGQLPQLVARLFPFKRGLAHAYWAPNFWALYLGADLILARVFGIRAPGATGGLVGSSATMVLPEVPPIATMLLTVAAMSPILWKVWQKPTREVFLHGLIPISLCSFLFGWHVHEKAILITIVPFTVICLERLEWSQAFVRLTLVGHFSLLPLLFGARENALRYFLLLAHWLLCVLFIGKFHRRLHREAPTASRQYNRPLLNKRDAQLIAGMALVSVATEWLLPAFAPQLVFLPLLLTSVYCAAWICYIFVQVTSLTLQL